MAKRYILEDDLSGQADAETHTIGLDGEWFEIDLAETNFDRLRASLREFLSASRRLGKTAAASRKPRKVAASRFSRPAEPVQVPVNSNGSSDNEAVRAWAKSRGIPIADRGRIKQEVRNQYLAEASNGNGAAESHAAAPVKPAGTRAAKKATRTVRAAVKPGPQPTPEEAREVYNQVGDSVSGFVDAFRVLNITEADARRLIRQAKKELANA